MNEKEQNRKITCFKSLSQLLANESDEIAFIFDAFNESEEFLTYRDLHNALNEVKLNSSRLNFFFHDFFIIL